MNIPRITTALTVVGALVAGSVLTACNDDGSETVAVEKYEDCDTEDQGPPPHLKREADCGYWQNAAGQVHVGAQPDMTWFWVWYSWVILGQLSRPHAGWVPPKGVKPPVKIVQVPKRKLCTIGEFTHVLVAPAPPKPPAPKPPAPKVNTNTGGGTAPKNNTVPKQQTPLKPGQRPAGC